MTAPTRRFRDPLDQMIHDEQRTCKGCSFRRHINGQLQCTHIKVADPTRNDRCSEYQERVVAPHS